MSAHESRRRRKDKLCDGKLIDSNNSWHYRTARCKLCIIFLKVLSLNLFFAVDIRTGFQIILQSVVRWKLPNARLILVLINVTMSAVSVMLTRKWISGMCWVSSYKLSIVINSNLHRRRIFSDGQFRWHFECEFKLMSSFAVNKTIPK